MSTKPKTGSSTQPNALRNATELIEAELEQVNGGIIVVLIGKSSQATPVFIPPGAPT